MPVSFRRFTAAFLCLALLAADPTYAAGAASLSPDLGIPSSLGRIEEFHRGRSGKTLIFIQDAHDSFEAQTHIAALVRHLVEERGVRTVYEEGYEGAVPTDAYFGFIADPALKEKVSYFLMDQLRIGGAEYAHVNRTRDFKLIGADSIGLHLKNIGKYREAAEARDEIQSDLAALRRPLEILAAQVFPKELKEWRRLKDRYDGGKLDLPSYLNRFEALAGGNPPASIALLLAAAKSSKPEDQARAEALDPVAVFRDLDAWENAFAAAKLQDERGRKIFGLLKRLKLLERLNRIEVSAEEYQAAQDALRGLKTQAIADFIARETHKPVLLSKRWENSIENALLFYETARARDAAVKAALESFAASEESTAALVFGGFHKDRILAHLKELGLSYAVVSPLISGEDPRHHAYYEQLMSDGNHPFEIPYRVSRASRNASIFLVPAGQAELRAVTQSVERFAGSPLEILTRQVEGDLADRVRRGELRTAAESGALKEFYLPLAAMIALGVRREETTKGPAPQKIFQVLREKDFAFLATLPEKETRAYLPLKAFPVTRDMPAAVNPGEFVVVYERLAHQYIAARVLGAEGKTYTAGEFAALARASAPALPAEKAYRYFAPTVTDWGLVMEANGLAASTPDAPGAYSLDEVQGKPFEHLPVDKRKESNTRAGILYRLAAAQGSGASYGRAEVWVEEKKAWLSFEDTMAYRRQRAEVPASLNLHHYLTQRALVPNNRRPDRPISMRELDALAGGHEITGIALLPGGGFGDPTEWWHNTTLKRDASGRIIDFDVKKYMEPARLRMAPFHEGVDVFIAVNEYGDFAYVPPGTGVRSAAEGRVAAIIPDVMGETVVVEHPLRNASGDRAYTLYSHVKSKVRVGDRVTEDTIVAEIADPGPEWKGAPPHLHFSLMWVPEDFEKTAGRKLDWSEYHKEFMPYNPFFMPFYLADIQHGLPIRDAAVPQGMKILERPDDPLQNIADGLTAMLRPAYLEFIYSFSEGRSAGGIILPPSGPSARQIELLQTILDLFELLGPKAEGARPMLLTFLNAVEKLRVAHGNFPAGIRRALRSIDGAPAVPLISHSKTIADKLAALLRLSDDEYVQGLAIELLGELGPAAGDALMSLAMQMGFYEGKAAQQGPFRFFYPLLAVLGALGQIRSEYPVSLLEEFTASPHHEALFEHLNHPLQQKAQDALRAIREKTAAPVSSGDRQVSRLISLIKISAFLYRQDPEAAPALFSLYSHEIRDRLFQLGPRAVKAGPALGELAEAASRAGDGATVELLQYLMRVIGFYFDEIPRKLAGEFYIPGLEIRAQIFQALEVLDGEVVVTVRVDGWKVEAHKESAGLEFDFNVKQELWNPEAFRRDAERFLRERLRLNAQGFLSRDDFYYGPLRELPTLAGASALHPEEKPTNTITITDDPPHAELRVPSPARGILRKRAELRTNLESPAILEDIRSRGALVFQWNAREEGKRFDQISEATLRRRVKQKGYNVIWMTGIWKPGKFTETFNKMWDPKRVGSAYSIEDYVINPDLGDEDSFMAFVDRANRLGIKVITDFIPNHMGADSTWIQEDPHYFLQGGPEDEATASLDDYTKGGQAGFVQRLYFMAAGPDGPVKISHGRDVGGPWIDTAQLDYAYPPLRPKLLETMRKIIRLTRGGGLRLDAADRTTRAAFLKMYGRDIGTEFWPDAFAALKAEFPTALFASETFWNDQQAFLNFGSDYVYDIPFYNLVVGTEKPSAQEITRHLTHTPFDTQKTLRSIENHDLPDGMRVLALLGKPRTQAAAILMLAGGPGAVMLYDGQIEGRTKEKPSAKHVTLHKRRETFDRGLQKFYEVWLKRTHDPLFRKGEAFEIAPGLAQRGIVAVRRSFEGREALVLVNYSASRARLDYAPEGAAWGMKGEEAQKARWRNAETGTARRFARAFGFDMKPWEYRVYFLEKPGRTELRAEDGAPQAGQPAPDNLERTFNFAVLATDLAIASAAGALAVFLVTLRLDLGLAGLAFWGATVLPTVIGLGILKALYYPWAKISTRWPTYGWGIPFAGLFGGAAAWAVQAWWGSGPQVQAWLSSGMLSAAAGFLIIKSLHDFFHALFFGDFDLAAEQDDLPRKPNRIHHYTETPSHYEIVSRPDEYTEIKIYIFKGDHPNLSIVRNRYLGEGEQRIVERSESLKRDGETITVRAWNEIEDPGLSPARNLSDADVLASWKEWAVSMMDLMDEMAAEVVMRGGVAEDDALRQRLAEEVGAIETYLKRAELRADDETAGEAEAEPEVRDPLERIVIGETAADWKEAQKIMRAAGAELDAGQERTLLAALHAPNLETAERRQLLDFLSTQYLNLIRYVARGMKLEGEAFDEAVQNGFFGLVEGLVRFDPAHETRLSTYAVWWIRHAIQRGESLETRPLSEHYRNKRRLVGQTRAKLSHQFGREPSLEELAEELHVGVDDLITLLSMPSRLDSLQRPLTSDTETTVGAMTQDRETETPLEEILSTEKHAVNKAEIL
ncbi:MAG TPA: alpha-amylase family glycosyl hydrolase, partial [Verrucomicrobiae bacterium]|nr:alpha-amylase family glycosyl hydrolase [Verrucomicrobiae bacterium]